MRMLLLAAAASLALAGCTTTAPPSAAPANPADAAIQRNLPNICASAETAHLLFVVAASFGSFSERTKATERAAWAALQPICEDPAPVTSGRVLDAALRAYTTIQAARSAAG